MASYEVTMERDDDVLEIEVAGTRTIETAMAISRDIIQAYDRQAVTKVLVDVIALKGSRMP